MPRRNGMASAGLDRETGKPLYDWSHTLQSVGVILTTGFGERVMRRYFGSAVPRLLGENMVVETFVRYFAAIGIALQQEPRVRLLQITPVSVSRTGAAALKIELEYRPRGHLQDFTPAGVRRVQLGGSPGAYEIIDATEG